MTNPVQEEAHTLEPEAQSDKKSPTSLPILGWHPRRRLLALASGPATYGLSRVAAAFPEITEDVYGVAVGPVLGWFLARLTAWIPFSIAEFSLLLVVVMTLHRATFWLRVKNGGRFRHLLRALVLTLRDTSLIVAVFMLIFGLHYARPELTSRLGWTATVEAELLPRLAEESLERVNARYSELHSTEDLGNPTAWPTQSERVDLALEESWPTAVSILDLPTSCAWARGTAKELLISPLLHRLGLSGFYFPWTGEANLNRTVPAMRRAFTLAHEKAHQRGIARENEASFVGWLAAETSSSPLLRYAASVYVHRRLVVELSRTDPSYAQELVRGRVNGVQRDVNDLVAYWQRGEGRATHATRRVNDTYLRGQGVHDGVLSYGRSTQLFLGFAAERNGTLKIGVSER